jgi:hypothetical protein
MDTVSLETNSQLKQTKTIKNLEKVFIMSKKETTVDASIAHMCFTRFTMSHAEMYKISALKVEYSAF